MSDHLPTYARGRYTLDIKPSDGLEGYLDVAVRRPGDDVVVTSARCVAEAMIGNVVRGLVRQADARRPPGDPLGEAARLAGLAGEVRYRIDHTRYRLADPDLYPSVAAYLAETFDAAGILLDVGRSHAATFAEMAESVGEDRGARDWRAIALDAGTLLGLSRRASGAAEALGRAAEVALTWDFTCGDCWAGECHWGSAEGFTRPEWAAVRRAEGEECRCARHDVSVEYARAQGGWPPDGEVRVIAAARAAATAIEVALAGLDLGTTEPGTLRIPAACLGTVVSDRHRAVVVDLLAARLARAGVSRPRRLNVVFVDDAGRVVDGPHGLAGRPGNDVAAAVFAAAVAHPGEDIAALAAALTAAGEQAGRERRDPPGAGAPDGHARQDSREGDRLA